jgi:hypothetical protein
VAAMKIWNVLQKNRMLGMIDANKNRCDLIHRWLVPLTLTFVTGSNDLKSAFCPFLLRGKDLEFQRIGNAIVQEWEQKQSTTNCLKKNNPRCMEMIFHALHLCWAARQGGKQTR